MALLTLIDDMKSDQLERSVWSSLNPYSPYNQSPYAILLYLSRVPFLLEGFDFILLPLLHGCVRSCTHLYVWIVYSMSQLKTI